MGGLVSVVLVGSFIAFLMYQNINNVTAKIEKKGSKGYEFFAKLSGAMIEYIKDIKRDINKKREKIEFFLIDEDKKEKVLAELDDFIRKLAFYETVLAQKKEINEIESEIAEIFIKFDSFIKENFKDGEQKANSIKESLKKIYQNR